MCCVTRRYRSLVSQRSQGATQRVSGDGLTQRRVDQNRVSSNVSDIHGRFWDFYFSTDALQVLEAKASSRTTTHESALRRRDGARWFSDRHREGCCGTTNWYREVIWKRTSISSRRRRTRGLRCWHTKPNPRDLIINEFGRAPISLQYCPTSVEDARYSAHARNSTHDLTSSKIRDKEVIPFDVQEDVGNAALSERRPSEPQEHPSNVPRSHLSTSSTKSLTLTTVQGPGSVVETTCAGPLAVTLGMTQGVRKAPALYGDTTVRSGTDVTGWQSGIKTAGKEFALGMYDGLSGILTQPYHGAKKEGGSGFVKGVRKQFAGFIAKPGAGDSVGSGFMGSNRVWKIKETRY